MDQYNDDGSPDSGLSIDDFSSPMEFADGGEVLSHTAEYQPTNQETQDYQDAHSMPMLSALAEGGPVGPSARDMLQKFAEGGEVAPQQGGAGAAWDLGISGDWNAPAVNLQPKKLAQVTPGLSASQISARNRAAGQVALEQAFEKADLPMDNKLYYEWQRKLSSGAVTPEDLYSQFAPAAHRQRVEQAYARAGIGADGAAMVPKNAGEMFKMYVNPDLTPGQMASINQKYAQYGSNWDLAKADKMRQTLLTPVLQAQDFYNRNPEARTAFLAKQEKNPDVDYVKFAQGYLASRRPGMGGVAQPGSTLTWDNQITVNPFSQTPAQAAPNYDYWVNKLVSGEITPAQFQTEFSTSAQGARTGATGYQYRDQWSDAPLPKGMYYADGGEVKKSEGSSDGKYGLLESIYRETVPAQARTFIETALMSQSEAAKSPITKDSFTDSEQRRMLDAIINARSRRTEQLGMNRPEPPPLPEEFKVNMEGKRQMTPEELKRLKQKQLDVRKHFKSGAGTVNYKDYPNGENITDRNLLPEGSIRNTLGQFAYKMLPDGRIRVMDEGYDFFNDLVLEGQRPTADYEKMGGAKKAWTLLKESVANPMDKDTGGFYHGGATLPGRAASAYLGRKRRPVDITIDPREIMPGYAGYADGGPVYRAEGSPATGEIKPLEDKYPLLAPAGRALKSPKQ